MKATITFLPSASSPLSVEGPSAMTWPTSSTSPLKTTGFWFKHVFWFERLNFVRLYISTPPVSFLTTILVPSTLSTTPGCLARTVTPESLATMDSIPVPTSGLSVWMSGTACLCMFEPMSALFASSFSRNGIRAAATETSWFGETSMRVVSSGRAIMNSPPLRAETNSLSNLPSLSMGAFACAMTWFSSSRAERYVILLVTLPSLTSL